MAAFTQTSYLRLRIPSNATADATYNLQRIDDLAASLADQIDGTLILRSPLDITLEPQNADRGGSGAAGVVNIGTASHAVTLNLYAGTINASGPLGLLDQASGGTKYLRLKYKSDAAGSADTTADRVVIVDPQGADRTVVLGGALTLAGALSTAGAFALTLTQTADTSVTLPTTGTLATLAGAEVLSAKTLASPLVTTAITLNAQAELRLADADSSNYVGLKAPATVAANLVFTLPATDGTSGQVLSTNGAGTLSWGSVATDILAQHAVKVGDASALAAAVDTSAVGDVLADSTGGLTVKTGAITAAQLAGGITYAKLSLSAGDIPVAKLAALTASRAVATDGSGVLTPSATTSTELGYVAGVTGAIQTQLAARLPLGGGTMTGAITLAADAANALEPVTKQQFDAAVFGLYPKAPVLAATTANITLSGAQTVDGVALVAGNRCLVRAQSTASQNGLYLVAAGAWTRTTDFDAWAEVPGSLVSVETGGSVNGGSLWMCTAAASGTVGSTSISFSQVSGPGTYTANGQALQLTGTQFALVLNGTTLSQSASGLRIAALGVTDAEVSASAAIAGTKVSPNFGSQAVSTTGAVSGLTLGVTGTVGAGYLDLAEQSADPVSPSASTLRVFGKTSDEGLYYKNSSGTTKQVGTGSGEKNYLSGGGGTAGASGLDGSSSLSGWAASGVTIATDTTGTNLPRPNTTKTALKITGGSSTSNYAYYRFVLDDADAGKKLKFQFDMKPGTAVASDFEVAVYSNTASDYTTGNTRLSLSTDSSAVSALPALTGTYRTTFDAPATTAKYLEVRIKEKTSNAHTLYISDVVVGPGVVVQGYAGTEWVSYTPVITNATSASAIAGKWKRDGDSMRLRVYWQMDSATRASGGTLSPTLPTGFTVDQSKVILSNAVTPLGEVAMFAFAAASQYDKGYVIASDGSTGFYIQKQGANASISNTDFSALGRSVLIGVDMLVPIAEWAGSGTVNVVQNEAQFLYNSAGITAANGTDSASFAYGPAGAAIGSIASTTVAGGDATIMRVRATAPLAAGSYGVLEFDTENNGDWVPIGACVKVQPFTRQGNGAFGAALQSINSTDFDVYFGNGGKRSTSTTFGLAGEAWSGISTGRWRVRIISGGQAVGFSEVQPGVSSGLVSASGVKGRTDGNAVAAGYVGEEMIQQRVLGSGTSATNATALNVTSTKLTLTPGEWEIMGTVCFNPAASTSITLLDAAISKTSATLPSSSTIGAPSGGESWTENGYAAFVPGAGNVVTLQIMPNRVTISANTDFYLVAKAGFTVSTMTVFGTIRARRIA